MLLFSMTYIKKAQICRNAAAYPEITTAAVTGLEIVDGKIVYTFKPAVGTKG
jgi:PRTRC genetic system protein C